MAKTKQNLREAYPHRAKKGAFRPPAFLLFLVLLFVLSSGLYAQEEDEYAFPAGHYWSLDAGFGWGGMMEDGKSFQFVIDPKLWLSPLLTVGIKAGVNYAFEGGAPNPDPDATSDTLMFESQAYLRWNFLRLGQNINKKTNIFFQAGLGLVAAYRGDANPFDDKTKTRGSVLLDAAIGATIPITERWHIEPLVRGGYPHLFGVSLTAGYKFPLPTSRVEYIRTESREATHTVETVEIVKMLSIASIEFILFGADIGSYNIGVDRDGQALNDLVMTSTANFLREHPEYVVRLEGNANPVTTDPREAEELMALSTDRANTVADELVRRGVPRNRIVVMAFGGTRTVTSERVRWDMNRRVEIIIMNANAGTE